MSKKKQLLIPVAIVATVALVTTIIISSQLRVAAEPLVGISIDRLSPDAPNPLGIQSTIIGPEQLAGNPNLPDMQSAIAEVDKRYASPYPYVAAYDSHVTLGQANALLGAFPFTETTEQTQGHKSYLTVLSLNNERYAVLLLFS